MVLAFMALAVPTLTAALSLAGTLSIDSQVKTRILKSQYSALCGDQYAQYLIGENQAPGTYPIICNGETVGITISDVPPIAGPPPPADNSRRLRTNKTATLTTVPVNTLTTVGYTITVVNGDDDSSNLTKIHDLLPAGFSYVAGTTTGIFTDEPSISGQQLTWNMSPLSLSLNPGDSVLLNFVAEANVPAGNYCNEAWAEPGNAKTSTGKTALVQVGTPGNNLCAGAAVKLTKSVEVEPGLFPAGEPQTYTYTITIENTGSDPLNLSKVRDLLPAGFLYLAGTTTGSLTTSNPNDTMWSGQQRLDWNFSPDYVIPSGQTETITFDMEGAFAGGHWNQVWLTLAEFADTIYSWPAAGVQVIDITESTTTAPSGGTVYSLVWQIGPESNILWEWEFIP